MPNKADKISADRLLIWLSMYLITSIPAYLKLYETIPVGLIFVLTLEEIVCYYIFEEGFLELYIDQVKKPKFTLSLFAISVATAFITLIWALFYEWKFIVLLVGVEIIAYAIRTFIKTKRL